ncbi:MAG: patatin-like phospholipase family protein [Candidatus Eiseniibacteriota bacterium]|jgi:predicted acylesterase/phospholipase RssA
MGIQSVLRRLLGSRRPPQKPPPRIGVALGGGLPFGVTAAGVLDEFERHAVPVHALAGTSMGAIVGALYGAGLSPAEIEATFVEHFQRSHLLPMILHDFRLSPYGFFDGSHLMKTIGKVIGEERTFEDLRLPFAVTAADLITGEEVVFDSGPVLPAIRASISLPAIFHPFEYGGRYLVDGAAVSPIPVELVERMGATITVAVRAVRSSLRTTSGPSGDQDAGERPEPVEASELDPNERPSRPPDLIHTLWRTVWLIEQDRFASLVAERADVQILAVLPADLAQDPDRLHELVEAGRVEARRRLPEVKALLAGCRPVTPPGRS